MLATASIAAAAGCGGGGGGLPRASSFKVVHTLRLGPRPAPSRARPTLLATSETRVVAVSVPGGRTRTLFEPGKRSDPVMVAAPSWAPDGRSFVAVTGYGADGRAVVAELGSGLRRTLAGRPFHPAYPPVSFSPDGRHLLYPRPGALYAYDLRRRRELTLVSGPLRSGSTVAWSPDARRIALDRDGGGIVVVDLRASTVGVLTRDGAAPSWSPDGKRIAFATTRGVRAKRCGEDGCHPTSDVDVIQSDGTGRRRLTHTQGDEWSPSWSPDGRLLAAQLRDGKTDYDGTFGLVTFAPDGSCYRTLVPAPGHLLGLGVNPWRPGSRPAAGTRGC